MLIERAFLSSSSYLVLVGSGGTTQVAGLPPEVDVQA